MSFARALIVSITVASLALSGCRNKPVREWRADDHDEEPGGGTAAGQVAAVNPATAGSAGADALAETTWRSTCAICHGMLGRGDGPNGPMVKAPDLTQVQATRTDEQLGASIRAGKGKMPAFPQLPPAVVAGLVRRIRAAATAE